MTENPRQNVIFPSNGGQAHGYLATPPSGSGPGVIMIQEWWGLDDSLVTTADRLAADGFVVLAPDLFGGSVAHDTDEAGQLMTDLPVDQAVRDLSGAVDYLLGLDSVTSERIGAVGFCMGGGFVLKLAATQGNRIGAAVPFYGVGSGVPDAFHGLTAPVQGHYGEKDDFYPVEDAQRQEEQIRHETGAEVTFYYYPAAHAFMNPLDRMGTYDPESAELAWSRTVDFLRDKLS